MDADLVLIHGFWSSPTTWDRLIARLRGDTDLAGLRIHTFGYESPKLRWPGSPTRIPDYSDIAQSLPAYLAARVRGGAGVAVVTHSQGGLIVQRYLAWMLAEGRGRELAKICLIVMLSCPNEGSEYLRSIRAVAGLGRHPQAGQLDVLTREVGEARRVVLRQVINATTVDDRHCPIPVYVYSGRTDNVVLRETAQSVFPNAEVLPGNHFSILDPDAPGHLTFAELKRRLLETFTSETKTGTAADPGTGHERAALPSTAGDDANPKQPSVNPIPVWLRRRSDEDSSTPSVEPWPMAEGEPPLLATAFQERPGVERPLDTALAPAGSTTVVTQVLVGDGGIGKTQLAAKTYDRAYTSDAYDLCLWVTATSSEAVVTWYARVMRRIDPEIAIDDPVNAAHHFLTWLRETRKTWFIVLDDVADPADIESWWPAGPSGRTLVTTRRRDASLSEHGRVVVDLGVFEPTEAKAYLSDRLSAPQARIDALRGSSELAEALGYLPLALSHASAVILDDGITCEEYQERFVDRTRTLIDLFPSSLGQRQRTVSATWSLAIDAANRLAPQGFSKPLLEIISVLDANGIPENVLATGAVRDYVQNRISKQAEGALGEEAVAQGQLRGDEQRGALRALHRLSLIVHDPKDDTRSVRMHALAQRATREAIDADTLQHAYITAADALIQAWPNIERDSTLSNVLRQNSSTLVDLAERIVWTSGAHPVLFRAGRSMEEVGLVGAALDYWKGMLSTCLRMLGPEHRDTLSVRREVAYCQGQCGDPTGAVTALEDLLADVIKTMGPNHRETLAIRRDLAWWRGETRDPAGAVAAYEELLGDMLRALGPDDFETLTTRYSLGRWRGQAGGPQPAIDDFRPLLQDCLRVVGASAPLTLAVRHDLAWWLGEDGDDEAAVAEFEALLPDRQRVLGPDHPYTLATRHDLAWWKWDAGDEDGAKAELEAVLTDYKRVMGPRHPHTRATREDLAFLLAGGAHGETHGQVRDTAERVPGDLPGLDFLQPAEGQVGWQAYPA